MKIHSSQPMNPKMRAAIEKAAKRIPKEQAEAFMVIDTDRDGDVTAVLDSELTVEQAEWLVDHLEDELARRDQLERIRAKRQAPGRKTCQLAKNK